MYAWIVGWFALILSMTSDEVLSNDHPSIAIDYVSHLFDEAVMNVMETDYPHSRQRRESTDVFLESVKYHKNTGAYDRESKLSFLST